MHNKADSPTIQRMQHWTEQFIVALNICPFAKREVERQRIRYTEVTGYSDSQLYDVLLAECKLLDENPQIETTLILLPELDHTFSSFLNAAGYAQQVIQLEGYTGTYQLANFHPDYVFTGSNNADPANYTNRSPHSALHLLREASLERVIRAHKHAEEIPQNNIRLLRELGMEDVSQRFARLFENQ